MKGRGFVGNGAIAAGAVSCLIVGLVSLGGGETATSSVQTATVQRGVVQSSVSATGNVQTAGSVAVNFASGGVLTVVSVNVGDHVTVGQPLAKIDDTIPKAALAAAQANLGSASAKLVQTQQSLDLPTQQQAVATAQQGVVNAQQNAQNDAISSQQAIATAQQGVVNAQQNAQTDATAQQQSVSAAQTTLNNDTSVFNNQTLPTGSPGCQAAGPPYTAAACAGDPNVTQGYAKLLQDQNAVTNAQNSANAKELADQQAEQNAQNALATAQNNATAKADTDQQSITNAQNALTTANINLQVAEEGNPSSLAAAEASVASAQSSVASAQKTENETTLLAPAEGTVSTVNAAVGSTVSGGGTSSSGTTSSSSSSGTGSTGATGGAGGTSSSSSSSSSSGFIALSNLTTFQVKAGFSESDVSKVAIGQPATASFSALTGVSVSAHVVAIDSTSTVTSNVVTYNVTVQLDQSAAKVKPGMTATVEVITAEADGALHVPSAAVQGIGTSGTVTVLKKGKQSTVTVGVGVRGDTSVEITRGLKLGQQVVTSTATAGQAGTGTPTGLPTGGGGLGGGGLGGGGLGGGRGG